MSVSGRMDWKSACGVGDKRLCHVLAVGVADAREAAEGVSQARPKSNAGYVPMQHGKVSTSKGTGSG